MGKHNFKSANEKTVYFSMLSTIYSEINNDPEYTVNEENYEETENELKDYIDKGYILNGSGYPLKKGTEPYALFTKFINGKEGENYEEEDKKFYFCLPENRDLYYHMTVNNTGIDVDPEPVSLEDARKEAAPGQEDLIAEDRRIAAILDEKIADDRQKFGQFAKELKDAARVTYHDSGEYKKIMAMLNKFNETVGFSNAPGDGPKQWRALDESQKQALPMLMLKCAINDYIDHKAADGVKVKDYEKLAAVEKLNKFVSERLRTMVYDEFRFNGVTYNENNPQLHTSYQEELSSARQHIPGYLDTADQSIGDKKMDAADVSKMQDYSSCMDRIMLAKQKKLVEKIKGCGEKDLGKGIDSLLEVRSDTISNVIEARNKAAEKKNAVKL